MLVSDRTLTANTLASWVSLWTRWMMHYRLPSPASMVTSVRTATGWQEYIDWNKDNLYDVYLLRHFPPALILSAARRFACCGGDRRQIALPTMHLFTAAKIVGGGEYYCLVRGHGKKSDFFYAMGKEKLCAHCWNSWTFQLDDSAFVCSRQTKYF